MLRFLLLGFVLCGSVAAGEAKEKPDQPKEKPAPKIDVQAPTANEAVKLLEGLGFVVPESGQTLRFKDRAGLGFPPYALLDVVCKNGKTKAAVFLRLERPEFDPFPNVNNMRDKATKYYFSAQHSEESTRALGALATRIKPELAKSLSEAITEWEKTKKPQARTLGGMGLRVNSKGVAIFTEPQVIFHKIDAGPADADRLDRP
jgi:hypothetical protein